MFITWDSSNPYDPYRGLIESTLSRDFSASAQSASSTLDSVVEEFIGTKNTRVGPRPNPESIVMMRDVVRRAMTEQRAIPVLSLSAAVKVPLGHKPDLAELSALKMLACLNLRIQKHYKPGIAVRVRMEDLTELVLSPEVSNVRELTASYIDTYKRLVRVLGYDSFITPLPESSHTTEQAFLSLAAEQFPIFHQYMLESAIDESWGYSRISALGWKGVIGHDTRNFLHDRYKAVYPERSREDHIRMMAEYFSATLVRHKLGAVGADPTFNGRLEVAFNPPLPNAPVVSSRVHYRSVPLDHTSNNRPYWYAKGYLKISESGARIALGRWEDQNYTAGQLTLYNSAESVTLDADYILE